MVGAVAVLEPGTPGLNVSVDGHVMDVVGVSGDSVSVRDMNWNYKPFQVSTHALAASSISGYIYPPGGAAPTTSTAASDLSATSGSPAPGVPLPFPGGILNPLNIPFEVTNVGIGVATGGQVGASTSTSGILSEVLSGIFGGAIVFLEKGGEVLIGVVAVFAGIFILVKHSSAGGSVINVATQTAKTGAKLAL
jgi:surface antigen